MTCSEVVMENEPSIEDMMEILGIPPEHKGLVEELLLAQHVFRQQNNREPNRKERRTLLSRLRKKVKS